MAAANWPGVTIERRPPIVAVLVCHRGRELSVSIDDHNMTASSLQGHLLISSPDLEDTFYRSVVLLVRHDDDGALGLILNRQTQTSVREVWENVCDQPCQVDDRLYFGGPCEGPLMALHTDFMRMEIEAFEGVYFSADREALEKLVANAQETKRFYVGYSGWGPGQLESEVRRGAWKILPANRDTVFSADGELWETLRRRALDDELAKTLRIKHPPADPSLN